MRIAPLLFVLLATSAIAADEERSIVVHGTTRTYRVHLPNGRAPRAPSPLVVVFHGGGGNAANAARMTGMDARSDREGFIVAYPNGTGPMRDAFLTWNAWRCCGRALEENVDDVGFVRALVQSLEADYAIDRRRIYATGMSNGGMMAYRVGCELSDLFAAIAPVAGALDTDDCRPASRVSVIAFHGTADRHVPFEGGAPTAAIDRHKRLDSSVAYAIGVWTRRDGCEAQPSRERRGSIVHDTYACAGQGHAWPGGEKGLRHGNVDAPTMEISATGLMWDFFSRHPKK